MRIRSITSFYDPTVENAQANLENLAEKSRQLSEVISKESVPVQSTRLATIPFPIYLDKLDFDQQEKYVAQLESLSRQMGWTYLSLGPAMPNFPSSYQLIPQLLSTDENVFCGGIMADSQYIYPLAVKECADVIYQNARLSADGFTNLRFSALGNVPAYAPFLPAAYAQPGEPPAIALAVECADIVVDAFKDSKDLEESRKHLLFSLEKSAQEISKIINEILKNSGVAFKGFDFSPAPFPEDWCSLGAGIEELGLNHIGSVGSLAAVAIIADTLDKGSWLRTGFNGMMLPVLEDSVLSRRAAEEKLTVKDMLLYSTVCGTGLDTIPLSGDVTPDELTSLLMDVAALSVRLAKPLTARLMPIPGKKAGDKTNFKFDFFSNSHIMALDGQTLTPPLATEKPIPLSQRENAKK